MDQIKQIIKRDGRTVDFNVDKIADAIYKAAQVLGGKDYDMARFLARQVEEMCIRDSGYTEHCKRLCAHNDAIPDTR